jgi:hypothetical protein
VKALWLFTILFLACGSAHSQSLRVLPVQIRGGPKVPAAIQFFCTENYNRQDCQNDISRLRLTLARYPLERLGPWSFVLASSDEWVPLMARLRLPAQAPAFSALGKDMTVLDQSMFSGPVDRRAELSRLFGVSMPRLIDLAVSHELGHAFCKELDERKTAFFADSLRAGEAPACGPPGNSPIANIKQPTMTALLPGALIDSPLK